ncbi:hypothetical protein V6N11_078932 [Hibiscus sabdariffa]|uniref:Uncharacterized protein n=1 Tax=Hibiscus sabdariffa TaxID=183260 RepID=A0ABR2RUP5_9ROSI
MPNSGEVLAGDDGVSTSSNESQPTVVRSASLDVLHVNSSAGSGNSNMIVGTTVGNVVRHAGNEDEVLDAGARDSVGSPGSPTIQAEESCRNDVEHQAGAESDSARSGNSMVNDPCCSSGCMPLVDAIVSAGGNDPVQLAVHSSAKGKNFKSKMGASTEQLYSIRHPSLFQLAFPISFFSTMVSGHNLLELQFD